ncbi:nucleotide disphospho-sugar-binding domain-containing protein [Frigoribacterium endophyticum]|uniref:nucleotide disphospho-sugar-binding domain-containing protein n=1 Tax=Frigoribacterium endophyticum TaxID=1522176 RepID=UPI00141F8C3D|nr:glycosyltransferase [Frigoribacterium endophyticum]NII49750.1 UDP:flavonoid glycosyltransferase YjiC (YdhE family) [Frigoribacterium endophyticum]
MTLLVISPDYASHLLPLATFATAWRDRGERVVVATGEATAGIVASFGFERAHLQLARGSNPGVIRAEEQPAGEDDSLRGFFDATRRGGVETLAYQARERLTDLMWQPVETARAVQAVVAEVQPDAVMVDHLAFSARLALVAGHVPHTDVVLGHPSALPFGDEVYGLPPEWPAGWEAGLDPAALADLRSLCDRVSASFTREWNTALAELDPAAAPSASAFSEHGDLLLYNYPAELADPERTPLLPPHAHLGSAVREEPLDPEVEEWLASSDEPFVYVSFGSFLSVRSDVLARVAAALGRLGVRAAIATGSAVPADLGELPESWLVRGFLPQVRLLSRAAAGVTHGGNNSVTESMTHGVPLVVLPFSTDQFAGAAALERTGVGVVLPPNTASVDELADAVAHVLDLPEGPREALVALSGSLRREPGRLRALAAVDAAAAGRLR